MCIEICCLKHTCVLLKVSIPQWASLYLPVFATLCAAAFTKSGWCYCVLHVLFENAMCVLKVRAVLAGFFDLGCAREWVVTQKLGSSDNGAASSLQVWRSWKANFYECTLGIFLLASAVFVLFCANRISLYLILQGTTDYIDFTSPWRIQPQLLFHHNTTWWYILVDIEE